MRIAETPLAILDLETTGRSPQYGDIVEASVVRLEPGLPPRLAFDSLIVPEGPLRCSHIHQIYPKDLQKAVPLPEILPALADALSGAIWVAYNVSFDLRFTLAALEQHLDLSIKPPHLCAAYLRSLLSLGKRAKLGVTCEHFGLPFENGQHIAVYDTWMTARLMQVWLARMSFLGLEHYGDLETLGTHKYLQSLSEPLWKCPPEVQERSSVSYRLQCSRYGLDLHQPSIDPRQLPPLSEEPPFHYGDSQFNQAVTGDGQSGSRSERGRLSGLEAPVVHTSSHAFYPDPKPAPQLLKAKTELFSSSPSPTSPSAPPSLSSSIPPSVSTKQSTSPQLKERASTSHAEQVKLTLRPYQQEAVDAILSARRKGLTRLAICLPTGAGKTVIFSHLASLARRRVLVLAHREELLTQAQTKLQSILGESSLVEIERASQHASAHAKVVVASLRSLRAERLERLIKQENFGLIIYDECHHAVAEDNQRVLRELGVFDDDFIGTLVGFTATTRRGDGIGLEEVFQEIVYHRNLQAMITDGYLVPLRGYRISTSTSLADCAERGEFPLDELEEKIDIQERNGLVARSIQELARDRRTICFCVTVRHAENLADTLRGCGVPAAVIHGELKSDERAKLLRDFREGTLQVLTNVGVLTEGFDDPEVSCIAMARPTRSETLYVQCVGRGMRLFDGKKDCLVLDFVDLSALNLITLPSLYGVPVEIDFEGKEASEVAAAYHQLIEATPGFEWEAEALTLSELKMRAQQFDPLRLPLSAEIRAISQSGWVSLGQRGLALHFSRDGQSFSELAILLTNETGSRRYRILLDETEVGRDALIERAVEAADYEVGRMGHWAAETSSMYADWRKAPVTPEAVREASHFPLPRQPDTLEELFRAFSYYKWLSTKE